MKYLFITLLLLSCLTHFSKAHGPHSALHPQSEGFKIIEEFPTVETTIPENIPAHLTNITKWILSENLAGFLNFHVIKSVSIPLEINIVPIGFEGEGNKDILVGWDEWRSYLSHVVHRISHSTTPLGEHQTTTGEFPTPSTSVDYRISTRVVQLCPLVNTLIEDHIYWNMRPEIPEGDVNNGHKEQGEEAQHTMEKYQVDVFAFSSLLGSLLQHLNIEHQYTLFLLNPHSPLVARDQIYGYRVGFSSEEIEIIEESKELEELFHGMKRDGPKKKKHNAPSATRAQKQNTAQKVFEEGVELINLVEESEKWAHWYIATQKKGQVPQGLNASCGSGDEEDDPNCLFNRPPSRNIDVIQFAKQVLSGAGGSTVASREYLYHLLQNKGNNFEQPLVDLWVSHNRFAFLDLTAGPFEWGPLIASEGSRSIGSILRLGSKSSPQSSATVKGRGNIPDSQKQYEAFKAEETILNRLWNTNCQSDEQRETEFCRDLQQRISNPSFGSGHDILAGSADEVMDITVGVDSLLLWTSNFLSQTLQHLIVPSSPLYPTPYTETVTFHFFTIKNHKSYDVNGANYFDYDLFKHEVSKLALPGQQFSFTLKEISLSSEGALGNGFSSSLTSCVLPRLNVRGEFSTEAIFYIDSRQLQHYLKLLNTDQHEHDQHESEPNMHTTKHIPIFFFSVDYPIPIFSDKYYQAKALGDMVIVVQSNISKWESRISANNNPIYYDLRNPLKAALSSTGLLVGGLVPSHISYNQPTKSAIQNWIWSVGDNPLAYTGSGYHFTDIQHDIAFRNYVVHALNSSIEAVNHAVSLLLQQNTNKYNAKTVDFLNLEDMSKLYEAIKEKWTDIVFSTHKLDYAAATSHLDQLQSMSNQFYTLAVEAVDVLNVFKCVEQESTSAGYYSFLEWLVPLAVAVDLVVVAIYLFIYSQQKPKLKIN